MSNPILEFTSILRKINDIYSQYLPEEHYDLLDVIEHYESKKSIKQLLIQLEDKTKDEWKKVLIILCDNLIAKLSKNKTKEKLYSSELNRVKKIKTKIQEDKLKLEDYDDIYNDKLLELKRDIESKLLKDNIEWKRFWWGLIIGTILGVLATIILNRLF